MKTAEIKARLQEMAEPRYAAFAGGLLPDNRHPLLGVRLPRLRQLARELAHADDARALLARTPGKRAAFEEIMLRGFVAGYAPGLEFSERCACIDRLVPFLDNWSLCDSCCATYRFVRLHRGAAWDWLLPYTRSNAEYERRFGIVMLLDHFIQDPAWAPRIARLLPTVAPGAHYSDMAVAWCACELCLRHPHLSSTLLTTLPPPLLHLTHRKLRESRRKMG